MAKKNDKSGIFVQQYIKSGGNITAACKATGIHRDTYYTWLKDPVFKAKIKDADLEMLEQNKVRAEAVVWKLMEGYTETAKKLIVVDGKVVEKEYTRIYPPNLKAALAWLTCHGRQWGWGEQVGTISAAQVNMLTNVVLRANQLGPEPSRELLLGIGIDPQVVESIIGTITNTKDTGLINMDTIKQALYDKLTALGVEADKLPDILSVLDVGPKWGQDLLNK